MPETSPRIAIWVAVIGGLCTIFGALAPKVYDNLQNPINSGTTSKTAGNAAASMDLSKSPSQGSKQINAATDPVRATRAGFPDLNRSEPKTTKLTEGESQVERGSSGTGKSPASQATSPVRIVIDSQMFNAEFWADGRLTDLEGQDENRIAYLPVGKHHLELKLGSKTCRSSVTTPQLTPEPVIITCH